jgi:hypothetical protein
LQFFYCTQSNVFTLGIAPEEQRDIWNIPFTSNKLLILKFQKDNKMGKGLFVEGRHVKKTKNIWSIFSANLLHI